MSFFKVGLFFALASWANFGWSMASDPHVAVGLYAFNSEKLSLVLATHAVDINQGVSGSNLEVEALRKLSYRCVVFYSSIARCAKNINAEVPEKIKFQILEDFKKAHISFDYVEMLPPADNDKDSIHEEQQDGFLKVADNQTYFHTVMYALEEDKIVIFPKWINHSKLTFQTTAKEINHTLYQELSIQQAQQLTSSAQIRNSIIYEIKTSWEKFL